MGAITLKITVLLLICHIQIFASKFDTSLALQDTAFENLNIFQMSEQARSYRLTAHSLSNAHKYDSSNYCFYKAANLYEIILSYIETQPFQSDSFIKKICGEYLECANQIGYNVVLKPKDIRESIVFIQGVLQKCILNLGINNIDVAYTFTSLGCVYQINGNYDDALKSHKQSLAIVLKHLILNDSSTVYDAALANIYNNIAIAYYSMGDYYTAIDYFNQDYIIISKLSLNNDFKAAQLYNNMAVCYRNINSFDIAFEYYQKALVIKQNILGPNHLSLAKTINNIGVFYMFIEDYDKSIIYLNQALEIKLMSLDSLHPEVGVSFINLGEVYFQKEEYNKTLDYFNKALKVFEITFGNFHPMVGTVYNNIGLLYDKLKDYDDALAYFQLSLHALVKDFNTIDVHDVHQNPTIKNNIINDKLMLLNTLMSKAEIFEKMHQY